MTAYFVSVALIWALPAIIINKLCFYTFYKCFGNNECIVDVAYSISHLVAAIVYAVFAYAIYDIIPIQDALIKLFLVALWALRLGGFLCYNRVLQGFKDPRYDKIFEEYDSNRFKKDMMVLGQFLFQGLIVFCTSIPLYFLFLNDLQWNGDFSGVRVMNYIFLGIIPISIFLEGLADYQLEQFKNEKKSGLLPPESIMESGLWRKSRHPNLFFDLVTWFCFAMGGIYDWISICGLIGPIILFCVMEFLTTPLTEAHMKKRRGEAFEQYCERTNKYFPF